MRAHYCQARNKSHCGSTAWRWRHMSTHLWGAHIIVRQGTIVTAAQLPDVDITCQLICTKSKNKQHTKQTNKQTNKKSQTLRFGRTSLRLVGHNFCSHWAKNHEKKTCFTGMTDPIFFVLAVFFPQNLVKSAVFWPKSETFCWKFLKIYVKMFSKNFSAKNVLFFRNFWGFYFLFIYLFIFFFLPNDQFSMVLDPVSQDPIQGIWF